MSSIDDLQQLLISLDPALGKEVYVFVTLPGGRLGESATLDPVATVREDEGLSLIVPSVRAQQAGLAFTGTYRRLTLRVLSSLSAVGLSAAVSSALAKQGISANIVAGFHHDHIFVPSHRARDAQAALRELSNEARSR